MVTRIQLPRFDPCQFSSVSRLDGRLVHSIDLSPLALSSSTSENQDEDENARDLRLARSENVDELYRLYGKRSVAFVCSLGLAASDAEDVMQHVWLRVLDHLRKKPFEGTFRAWLFQILRHATIDFRRKKRPDPLDAQVASETLRDESPLQAEPIATLIDDEHRSALQTCIEKLPETIAAVVRQRLLGKSSKQIASDHGIKPARSHKLFFEGKRLLTNCMSKSDPSIRMETAQ